MISIELIRRDPDLVREAMRKRAADVPVDEILSLDEERRSLIVRADALRARRNEVSREMGRSKDRPQELIEEMRSAGSQIRELEERLRSTGEKLDGLLLRVPNIPDESAPVGPDESANVVVKRSESFRVSTSSRRPTGTSPSVWGSSTSSAGCVWQVPASSSSEVWAPSCNGRLSRSCWTCTWSVTGTRRYIFRT